MPAVRPMSHIKKKWVDRAGVAGPEYEFGIKNPRKVWADEASKAQETYKKAITDPSVPARYKGGVEKTGQKKYVDMATRKGITRFPEGVTLGQPFFEEGFTPYRDEIEKTELPPKLPKGDPGNITRVSRLASAMHEKKKAILGVSS